MKRFIAGLFCLVLAGCSDWLLSGVTPARPWQETQELIALVPNGPTTLFVDAAGTPAGLEHDLVSQFAAQNGLKVRFIVTGTRAEALERLRRGEAHLAAGVWRDETQDAKFGPVYQTVEPVLIFSSNTSSKQLEQQLSAGQINLKVLPEHAQILGRLHARWSAFSYTIEGEGDGEALFEQVAAGDIPAALIDGRTAEVMQNYYPQVAIKRGVSENMSLSWALAPQDEDLHKKVASFMKSALAGGQIRHLAERYYGHVNRLETLDSRAFLDRRESILPDFRNWFHEAEAKTGLDWRLVAALAYQESHWNPAAVSPTGVRGLMMLTSDTAQSLGVDRLDAYQSIMGGARYMKMLIDRMPSDIPEPDRTWLALASYNVGMGHMDDARILAKRLKKNPDSWADMKTVLPLLRKPEYFSTLKYGYARGGEPVIFVESLRNYFDILARFEKPYQRRPTSLANNEDDLISYDFVSGLS